MEKTLNLSSYSDMIRESGKKLIDKFNKDHIIIGGVNGPYDDPETPVRNIVHLIIITAIEIEVFNSVDYEQTLIDLSNYLLSLKDENGLFILRNGSKKDKSNGVIGHSWVIEGLLYLYKHFKDPKYLDLINNIATHHKFSEVENLWYTPFEDTRTIDYTLNHQMWYCASLLESNRYLQIDEIENQCLCFMNNLETIFTVQNSGRIKHSIYKRKDRTANFKQAIKLNIDRTNEIVGRPSLKYKEQGYHVFNLMALARIYNILPEHPFFQSRKFKKSLGYLNTREFFDGLHNTEVEKDKSLHNAIKEPSELSINIYGYPYNVPGLEIIYVYNKFYDYIDSASVMKCIKEQFELTYNISERRFDSLCHDKETVNYRAYEYYRYLELN